MGRRSVPAEPDQDTAQIPDEIPVLPLKNTVIFPLTTVPLLVKSPKSIRMVDDAVMGERLVALVALRDPDAEDPDPDDLLFNKSGG